MMSKILHWYLRFWTKIYLKRAKPKIIAVTGSIGKTSTKEAIFEVLKIKFGENIRKSEGNLNNETGVPLAVLGFSSAPSYGSSFLGWLPIIFFVPFKSFFGKKTKILILEMAADKPGDIKYLTSFVKPDIAVLTAIAPAHLEAFGTMEKLADEKAELLRALPKNGIAILNIDDKELKKVFFDNRFEILTYAINEKADIVAKNITTEINDFLPETKFQVLSDELKFRAQMPTLGRIWNVYSALAATSVATIFKMSAADIIKGIGNIKPEKHRMAVLKGKKETLIIDDSYNANPLSMKAALDVLKFLPEPKGDGRKIAVIGDMLEIGKITNEAHKLIGQYAKEVADEVVAVGVEARKYQADKYFQKPDEASDYLLANIKKNDIILIKASRAIGLEKIVETLEEEN